MKTLAAYAVALAFALAVSGPGGLLCFAAGAVTGSVLGRRAW